MAKTTRKTILAEAERCVCEEREEQYGSPKDNFKSIADLWSAYKRTDFTPLDVAMMMALLKIARIKTGTATADSFVDLAGYAACGGEIESGHIRQWSMIADEMLDYETKPHGTLEGY